MARDISARALQVIKSGPSIVTRVTVTAAGDPVQLRTSPGWSVQEVGPVAGTRLTISGIQFLPTDGVYDLFALVGYPGAIFDAFIGINLGVSTEWVQVFSGVVVDGSSSRNSSGVSASLADRWSYFDRIALSSAFTTTVGASRAEQIASLFTMLDLGVSVVIDTDGGDVVQAATYTNSRSQAATDLAQDGMLQAGFDGGGDLVIKSQPDVYSTLTPVWTFKSGNAGLYPPINQLGNDHPTIVAGSLERSRSWADALVNSVEVAPNGDWQAWPVQVASLTDTTDPRHEDNVGLRRIQLKSNTIDNACDALLLAKAELGRLLRGSAERARVTVAINPAVEADDVLYLAAGPTLDDPAGWGGTYIATSVTHDPASGTTSIEAVSAAAYPIGQAA